MAKTFSGKFVINILEKFFNFQTVSQKGSHLKLERINSDNSKNITIVPNHKELAIGTVNSVLKLANVKKEEFLKFAKNK
jgi:predicted RNA binding protein YcfA (HicA-like mRNA interferase family)